MVFGVGDHVRTKHAHIQGTVLEVANGRLHVEFAHPVAKARSWIAADTVEALDEAAQVPDHFAEARVGGQLGPLHAGGLVCYIFLVLVLSPEERGAPISWLILTLLFVPTLMLLGWTLLPGLLLTSQRTPKNGER